jgi:DNA-binding GntR family transcriptional regulator
MSVAGKISAVGNAPLGERIYQELRTAIMRGRFAAGHALTLRDLAKVAGTSAMPVRDALMRLVAERAVVMPNVRSFAIPFMSHDQFKELCRFRILVECFTAGCAAERLTEDEYRQIEELDRKITRSFRAGSFEKTLEGNLEFTFAVYRAARLPVVIPHIESLWLQSGPYLILRIRKMAEDRKYKNAPSIGHHQELLKALKSNDVKGARDAVKKDITETMLLYLSEKHFNSTLNVKR